MKLCHNLAILTLALTIESQLYEKMRIEQYKSNTKKCLYETALHNQTPSYDGQHSLLLLVQILLEFKRITATLDAI